MNPLPKIDPKWRTATVVELCQSMREAQDFSAMPILADALQDANCDHDDFLAHLRSVKPLWTFGSMLTAWVMSDETAEAVTWIEDFVGAHDGSMYEDRYSRQWMFNDFLEAAAERLKDGSHYIVGGTELEGELVPDAFWEKYELVTGRIAPHDKRGNFFTCSC